MAGVPLQRDQVKYIALEGGGGAGNAFPGAIRALSDPRLSILQYQNLRPANILGFSGASAGAITALFLSCGYDGEEISHIMATTNFDDFFDRPRIGLVPRIGGCRREGRQAPQDPQLALLMRAAAIIMRRFVFPPVTTGLGMLTLPQDLIELQNILRQLLAGRRGPRPTPWWIPVLLGALMMYFRANVPTRVFDQITSNLRTAVDSVRFDYGIFPGCVIRGFFEKWIKIARYRVQHAATWESRRQERGKANALDELARRHDGGDQAMRQHGNMTFQQHEQAFGVKLAVAGTNLETYKSHLFSASTSPRFLVADAVRISMSLPFAFKPLIIHDDQDLNRVVNPGERPTQRSLVSGRTEPHYLKGVWVDGGLLNNLPLHAFDDEPGANPKTLGLRLNFEERTDIQDFGGFFSTYPLGILMGTGESHLSQTRGNYEQSIILDPKGIKLFDFNPPSRQLRQAQDDAHDRVLRYFGLNP